MKKIVYGFIVAMVILAFPFSIVFAHEDEGREMGKKVMDKEMKRGMDEGFNKSERMVKKHVGEIKGMKVRALVREKILTLKNLNLTPEERKALVLLTVEEIKEIAREKDEEEIREKIKEKIKKRKELERKGWKIREIALEEKRERMERIREMVEEIKEKIKEKREFERELREMKREYDECKEEEFNTAECEQVKEEYLNKSKEYLLRALDLAEKHLLAVRDKLEASEYINESEVQRAIAEINDLLDRISNYRDQIQQCEDLSCLRDIAVEMRKDLKKIKIKVKEKVYDEERFREGLVIERGKAILARLEFIIDYANKKNISLEEFVDDIEEIKQLVAEAEELKKQSDKHMELAKKSLEERDLEGAEEHIDMAKDALEEARDKLKDAHETLQEIWNYIKKNKELRYILVARESRVLEEKIKEIEREEEEEYEYEEEIEEEEGEKEKRIEIERETTAEIENETAMEVEEVSMKGRLEYRDIEGGVVVFIAEDGTIYHILNAEDFDLNLTVNVSLDAEVKGYVVEDVVTTAMIGTPFKAIEIEVEY